MQLTLRPRPRYQLLILPLLILVVVASGCTVVNKRVPTATTPAAGGTTSTTSTTSTTVAATGSTTTAASTTSTTLPPFKAAPGFVSSQATITAAQLGPTWHKGCPLPVADLASLQMTYWGFDGKSHTGTLIVSKSEVTAVLEVFSKLYADKFPIQEMVPESSYGGSYNAVAAANDTSDFNCRYDLKPGKPVWSDNAYGLAIDVNDLQNPYLDGATVIPSAGSAYKNRSDVRPGMAVAGGPLVAAFASVGWHWGGVWKDADYQHFSPNDS